MALLFDANGDECNFGNGGRRDDVVAGSFLVWVYLDQSPSSAGRVFDMLNKGVASDDGADFFLRMNAANNLIASISRATQGLLALAPLANFSAYGTGKWIAVAWRWDLAAGDTSQDLFMGDLSTPLAEPSSYSLQRQGSGAITSNAGVDLHSPGASTDTATWTDGRHARLVLIDSYLTTAELQAVQFMTPAEVAARWGSSVVIAAEYGLWGTGALDFSGNAFHGSGTGTAVAAHVPLRVFGAPARTVPAAAATSRTGTGRALLAALAAAGVGDVPRTGTGQALLAALAAAGVGSVGSSPIAGTGAAALGAMTAGGQGDVLVQGAGGALFGALDVAGQGDVDVVGDGQVVLGSLGAGGQGDVLVQGLGGVGLPALRVGGYQSAPERGGFWSRIRVGLGVGV